MAMLRLSGGGPRPDPAFRYGAYPQPPMGAGHWSTEYDSRPAAVREARAQVRGRLEDWGLADRAGLVDTAALLVSELATSSVLDAGSRFRLTLTAAHGILRCEVTDTGRRVGPAGGPGRFLVDALARRWGCYRDGPGRTVWFELGTCACE
ncbi:ATP-binding protein [Streptomyces sp. NPDC049687]|uniref:ATP-binding protein n=1 Tax=Streptomyces sp. NPDC049687 TaxID=3365596 RepID=UPI0037A4ADE0